MSWELQERTAQLRERKKKMGGWVIVYIRIYVCMVVGSQGDNLGEITQKPLRQQHVQKCALSPGRQESVKKRQTGSLPNSLGYKWEGRETTSGLARFCYHTLAQ